MSGARNFSASCCGRQPCGWFWAQSDSRFGDPMCAVLPPSADLAVRRSLLGLPCDGRSRHGSRTISRSRGAWSSGIRICTRCSSRRWSSVPIPSRASSTFSSSASWPMRSRKCGGVTACRRFPDGSSRARQRCNLQCSRCSDSRLPRFGLHRKMRRGPSRTGRRKK